MGRRIEERRIVVLLYAKIQFLGVVFVEGVRSKHLVGVGQQQVFRVVMGIFNPEGVFPVETVRLVLGLVFKVQRVPLGVFQPFHAPVEFVGVFLLVVQGTGGQAGAVRCRQDLGGQGEDGLVQAEVRLDVH